MSDTIEAVGLYAEYVFDLKRQISELTKERDEARKLFANLFEDACLTSWDGPGYKSWSEKVEALPWFWEASLEE